MKLGLSLKSTEFSYGLVAVFICLCLDCLCAYVNTHTCTHTTDYICVQGLEYVNHASPAASVSLARKHWPMKVVAMSPMMRTSSCGLLAAK